jgi:hypothetical protein
LYSQLRYASGYAIIVDHLPSANLNSEDGGGPGSISQLLFIQEFLRRIEFDLDLDEDTLRPADYWDLMGGVGFGGHVFFPKAYSELTFSR